MRTFAQDNKSVTILNLLQFMQVDNGEIIVGGFIDGVVCSICRPRKA